MKKVKFDYRKLRLGGYNQKGVNQPRYQVGSPCQYIWV